MPTFSDTTSLLQYLYADLTRISEIVSEDIILHPADRDLSSPPKASVEGVAAVQAHEEALLASTGGTLVMDVESITANDHFGTALGVLRAKKEGKEDLAIPFCGVWRFKNGKAVEHWENAADVKGFAEWVSS